MKRNVNSEPLKISALCEHLHLRMGLFPFEMDTGEITLGDVVHFAFESKIDEAKIVSLIKFCKEEEDGTGIAAILRNDRESIAISLLASHFPVTDKSILAAFQYKKYKFALEYLSQANFQLQKKHKKAILDSLLSSLQNSTSYIVINLFFMRKFIHYFSSHHIHKFISMCHELLLDSESNAVSFIKSCLNPLQAVVLILEIGSIIQEIYPSMSISIGTLSNSLTDLAFSLEEEIDTEEVFQEMMLTKDLEGRTTIQIITERYFIKLLENKYIEAMANDVWKGPFKIDNAGIANGSVLWEQLTSGFRLNVDTEKLSRKQITQRDFQLIPTHCFVYACFCNGAFMRLLLSSLECLAGLILIYALYFVINDIKALNFD